MIFKKANTIFHELVYNIIIPLSLSVLILGILNITHTRNLIKTSNAKKNQLISDEINYVLEFQDVALDVLEENLGEKMRMISNTLVNEYFNNTQGISEVNLDKIRDEVGLDKEREDIYIINRQGKIVNTTFKKDLGLDLFSFGEDHKNYILGVFEAGTFISERFTIESSTRRLRKYSYEPTADGAYIIELGYYSERADEIIEFIKSVKTEISKKEESVISVELFIGADNPFSLDKDARLNEEELDFLKQRFVKKDSISLTKTEDGKRIEYEYYYNERENSDLYKGSVIRLISDRSGDMKTIRNEVFKIIIVLIVIVYLLLTLVYNKTKSITYPIKRLEENVKRITNGHFNERAEVIGNNEITVLSKHFNLMISELESYYNELEQKVRERTIEIQQQKEEIEAQRDAIEVQRDMLADQKKHITDSIRYAQRIQNAILPENNYIRKLLPESFVYYKPKDIVSGDFYWVNEIDNKVLFAAVDCTGHGVPGAFMSIMGNNHLNYALKVFKANKPADILDQLNYGVSQSLRQDTKDMKLRDGMDIALCMLDYENMKLEYAGAFNPLYIIRNGEALQYKADKFPIGSYIGDKTRNFTNHEIDLRKGDVLYIFSDGFTDQFGGPDRRKFLIKNFRNLLVEISDRPMSEQREILDTTLTTWKGDQEQVDDVLVFGVRI